MKHIKIVVEKHPEGYVAYPLGIQGGCDLNAIQLLSSNRKPILIELIPKLLPTS